jgi:hypothetical protein
MASYVWNRHGYRERPRETTERAFRKAPQAKQPSLSAYERGAYAGSMGFSEYTRGILDPRSDASWLSGFHDAQSQFESHYGSKLFGSTVSVARDVPRRDSARKDIQRK